MRAVLVLVKRRYSGTQWESIPFLKSIAIEIGIREKIFSEICKIIPIFIVFEILYKKNIFSDFRFRYLRI